MWRVQSRVVIILILAFVGGNATRAGAEPIWYPPLPYLSADDSPFAFNPADFPVDSGSTSYYYFEDFEDGFLNTPGVSVSGGVVMGPGTYTDSVDGDDGVLDGVGSTGHSLYSNWINDSLTFTFDEAVLGTLPTHAGVVMTDIGYNAPIPYFGPVTLEAFGPGGDSLGTLLLIFGDGHDQGEGAEDRFLGLFNPEGISGLTISTNNFDWEVDHLQYAAVPEPGTLLLMGVGLLGARAARRRKHPRG
jgi:hypothetical protein